MSKKIILLIIIIIVIVGIGFWAWQSMFGPVSEGSKNCVGDDDCVVFGKTGDCNCGCYSKNNLPSGTGGECFCLAPLSCKCVNNKCEGVFVDLEQSCINSEGKISNSLCCKSTGDFPNLCLIGPCGCSPENSHQVKICDCGEGRCFDGEECVEISEKEMSFGVDL